MAKLNEQPPVVDPLESLRRKFLRQNRDIARDNSIKSLRIRDLENEVSRLLATNLSYREQVIQLQSEHETCHSQRIFDHVNDTKAKLETQLFEIGNLVASLSNRPTRPPSKKAVQIEAPITATTSPGEKNWKNTCTINEALTIQDGRLPPIMEDKQYPRRTMDTEILETLASVPPETATDSPDIGPPPVSQFMTEDPVKLDLPKAPEFAVKHEQYDLKPVLSVNLEQRRRRRESIAHGEQRRASRFEPVSIGQGQAFRAGAKRKIGVRDEDNEDDGNTRDEMSRPLAPVRNDRIMESHRLNRTEPTKDDHSNKSNDKEQASEAVPVKAAAADMETMTKVVTLNRKPLGSKSANVDIANSPRKDHKTYGAHARSEKPVVHLSRQVARTRNIDKPEINLIEPATLLQKTTVNIKRPDPLDQPETPAAGALLSPLSSQPSTMRKTSRDTPPPAEIGEADGQRPSRRSRASVNYVQPNLRDKMRRPTKELVDAVDPGVRQRQSSIEVVPAQLVQSINAKTELNENQSWTQLPATTSIETYSRSPLGNRSASQQDPVPSTAAYHPKHKPAPSTDNFSNGRRSETSSATLFGTSHSCVGDQIVSSSKEQHRPERPDKGDVYEFQASPECEVVASQERDMTGRSKSSRRHSALSRTAPAPGENDLQIEVERSSSSNRRRQSTIDSAVTMEGAEAVVQKFEQSIRRSNSSSVRSSAMRTKGSDGTLERRRSMML